MNQCKDISYRYKDKIYHLNPLQQTVFKSIKSLPRKHLHYIVAQQSKSRPNLSLKQMKTSIRRAVRGYIRESNYPYRPELDNLLVQYLCVFETTKKFHQFICSDDVAEKTPYVGLHFHLFITSPDNYPWVCFNNLSCRILKELSRFPKKAGCISNYDYRKLNTLENEFVLYHTKQLYKRPSREMILTNVT